MNRKQPEPKAGGSKPKPGPEPQRLNIEGDIGDAVSRIVGAGKPTTARKVRALRARRKKKGQ